MKDDPIVEEARRAGNHYIKACSGLSAAVADLKKRTEASRQAGRVVIASPLQQTILQRKKQP